MIRVCTFSFDFGQVQYRGGAVRATGRRQVQGLFVRPGPGPTEYVGNVVGRGRPGRVAVHVRMPRAGHRRFRRRRHVGGCCCCCDDGAGQVGRRLPVAAVHHHQHFTRIASHRWEWRRARRRDGGAFHARARNTRAQRTHKHSRDKRAEILFYSINIANVRRDRGR